MRAIILQYRRQIGLVAAILILTGFFWVGQQLKIVTANAQASLPGNILDGVNKTAVITDRHGEPLYYAYKDQNRIFVDGKSIAPIMKDAIIAAEDERFYLHRGFDMFSIARALMADWQQKSIVSGGSTLTMQLVKNLTLDKQPTWQRKIKEVYLASVIEQQQSKEQILTAYLNIVPLGNNLGGVETASRLYFHVPASQLTLAQAATLAALPTAPEFYATHPEALQRRRNYVLDRMVTTGKINQSAAGAAKSSDTRLGNPAVPFKAAHFVMLILEELKTEYGERFYTKGLTIKTTLDLPTQTKAEQAVKDNAGTLRNVGAGQAGMVVMDPQNGQVLAMVGSTDYFNKKTQGEVNFTTAPLSYGSTLKPIIYAMLLEKEHWSPGAIMWDIKTDFPIQGERKPYQPNDYDKQFFGPMTLRQALANSRNVTAVKALQMVGLKNTLERLQDWGVSSLGSDSSKYGPSLAVGGGGIPLLQLAGAYTALANNGLFSKPQLVLRVIDSKGRDLTLETPKPKNVLRPEVAYEIADILQDNEARKRVFGPNSPLVIAGHTVAAKTGTAEDYRSALTVGYTPDILTAVIVANHDNSPLRQGGSGAMAAAPFWNSFMTHYLADKPNNWYARPDSVKEVEFASVIGKIKDLAAPWQSPTDRFNKRVAETDDPYWNRAVLAFSKPKTDRAKVVETSGNNPAPAAPAQSTPLSTTIIRADIPSRENKERNKDKKD